MAPDKFRGTASAPDVAAAICRVVDAHGAIGVTRLVTDGGEGTLELFGGPNRWTTVPDPVGRPVRAGWRVDGDRALIVAAGASGLILTNGASGNDPIAATTHGVGQLIVEAAGGGATDIAVTTGGVAATDGGLGAVEAVLAGLSDGISGLRVQVLTDVRELFVNAAIVFGPQKGADAEAVTLLTQRLTDLAARYLDDFGVDVTQVPGSGASGGLAGGLLALGAELHSGFDVIADWVGLSAAVADADLVITGEGRLDRTSFTGKVVGGITALAASHGVPTLAVVGQADPGLKLPSTLEILDLTGLFGSAAAGADPIGCLERALSKWLAGDR